MSIPDVAGARRGKVHIEQVRARNQVVGAEGNLKPFRGQPEKPPLDESPGLARPGFSYVF